MGLPKRTEFENILSARDITSFRAGLPQGSKLDESDITRWMDYCSQNDDFNDSYWHYCRLAGISGSESLAAVMHFAATRGKPMFDPVTSPTDFAAAKLLKTLPGGVSGSMQRGNRLKSHIVDLLIKQTGGKVRYDLMEQIAAMSGQIKDHPWLVGDPDLVIEFPSGRIYLADIEAPDDASDDFPFGYTVQLHHYRELALHTGISLDGMLLCNFDWKNYKVLPLAVPHQPEVTEAIYIGGDDLWNLVCDGTIPCRHRFDPQDLAPVPVAIQHEIADIEERYLALNALTNEIAKSQDVLSTRMRGLLEQVEGATERKPEDIGLSFLGVNGRSKINEAAVRSALEAHDKLDKLDEISVLSTGYDSIAMAERLIELGDDLDQFRLRKFDAKKTLALLGDMGISRSTAKATGLFSETIIPVYRVPKKYGSKLDAHLTLTSIATNVSSDAIKKMTSDIEVTFSDGIEIDAHISAVEQTDAIEPTKQVASTSPDDISNASRVELEEDHAVNGKESNQHNPSCEKTLVDFLNF